jgi:hypothetical protein
MGVGRALSTSGTRARKASLDKPAQQRDRVETAADRVAAVAKRVLVLATRGVLAARRARARRAAAAVAKRDRARVAGPVARQGVFQLRAARAVSPAPAQAAVAEARSRSAAHRAGPG